MTYKRRSHSSKKPSVLFCHCTFITAESLAIIHFHVGMMIECMAGKSASMHGMCHDATPFTFSEDMPAIDHFGKLLTSGLFFITSQFN